VLWAALDKEIAMYHLTNPELFLSILALALAVILGVRSVLGDRKEKSAPFRNYFGSGYQRELLRHSELSESEEWRTDLESRFARLRQRDPSVDERRNKVSSANLSDHEAQRTSRRLHK
jgi:hypothetical protein